MSELEDHSKTLFEVKRDLAFLKDYIKTIATEVLDQDISKYPLFIAHKEPIELGRLALASAQFETKWNISASLLEELVNKSLINDEKLDEFKMAYKDPYVYMCVMVVGEGLQHFLFYPYD